MYVAVYAICKDEGQFVDRWMASMGEADGVFVLDTGSSDGTPERLRALGAQVREETISPWRFDTARNRSLELVPPEADICVCTDLDEVFQPGWREKVEAAWTPGTDRLLYRYTWNFLPDGREGTVYWYDKIHRRWGCRWVHPVHEVLAFDGGDPVARYVEGVHLEHHPDPAKSRAQYLPLLELAVEEDPDNDRNVHYLGREYFFHRRWEESIALLKRHLALPTATWADERCASMRLLAKDCFALAMEGEGERWLLRAAGEAPHLREPWLDLADLCYRREDWAGVLCLGGAPLGPGQSGVLLHRAVCQGRPGRPEGGGAGPGGPTDSGEPAPDGGEGRGVSLAPTGPGWYRQPLPLASAWPEPRYVGPAPIRGGDPGFL